METKLIHIRGDNSSCVADVIFLHGLDGDAFVTWGGEKQNEANTVNFWPRWLAEDVPDVNVWSLDYDAASSGWRGNAMPLTDRATNILALLGTHGIGQRPLLFIAHSMGGLLAKQLLRSARDKAIPQYAQLPTQVKGILFLSTPHTGSALASAGDRLGGLFPLLRTHVTLEDLRHHDPALRDLNEWFRNNYEALGMRIEVIFESQETRGVRVVNETSADPGIAKIRLTPVDEDHITISKPASRDSLVYRLAVDFVRERVRVVQEATKPPDPR